MLMAILLDALHRRNEGACQMTPSRQPPVGYLEKATQSLKGAGRELTTGAFDNTANRAYYAAFQAAVAALWTEGLRPAGDEEGMLSHRVVRSEWAGRLIYRRKRYPAELRTALSELWLLRVRADYKPDPVTERQARRAVLLARQVVAAVVLRLQPPGLDLDNLDSE